MTSDRVVSGSHDAESEDETFYSNLSDSMHAASQALTVLQVTHNADRMLSMGSDELIDFASSSIQEIERLRLSLGYLSQFVAIRHSRPRLSSIDVSVLIEDAIDGLHLLFRDMGIHLDLIVSRPCEPVMANAGKVSQALSGVLLVAYGISKGKDTVAVSVSSSGETVDIEVQAIAVNALSIDADISLRLRVAESLIRSQNGIFSMGSEPFWAKICLPKANQIEQRLSTS